MKTTHRLTITCRCPIDESTVDVYDVAISVETDLVLPVESILDMKSRIESGPSLFQEQITLALAKDLEASVTTIGRHSGVETTCEA